MMAPQGMSLHPLRNRLRRLCAFALGGTAMLSATPSPVRPQTDEIQVYTGEVNKPANSASRFTTTTP